MTPKKSIALIVSFLCCTHEIHGALSNSDQKRIRISDPLVLLTGTSKYDTIKDLDSVEDEMKELYTLFKITCGYDVKSTYFNDNGDIIYDHNEVVNDNGEEEKINDDDQNSSRFRGRLSQERLQDFIEKQSSFLYKHRKKYDALIFIFSGHGYGNKKGNDMLLCSNFCKQGNQPKNHVFLADIQARFTDSTNSNYVKDFSGKPKLFFDLACRGGRGGKSLNFKEDKSQYKGVENTYEAANVVTYYTTTPGRKTNTEVGVKFVKFLSEKIKKSLNKTAYKNSLDAIMKKVSLKTREHNGCPDVSGPLSLHADNIFFAPRRKIIDEKKIKKWIEIVENRDKTREFPQPNKREKHHQYHERNDDYNHISERHYMHGKWWNPSSVNKEELKEGLIRMYQKAVASPYQSIYIHTILSYWLQKSKIKLQQETIQQIMHYADHNRELVYFFTGLRGEGKSTAIFALQGNKVEEKEDDDWWGVISESESESRLIYKKRVKCDTPQISHYTNRGTANSTIYYHGNPTKDIAFCDNTEDVEQWGASEAEKCISAFSNFFALKTNKIGGIVWVVSTHTLMSVRGNPFMQGARFFLRYFNTAHYTHYKEMSQSMILMITKCGPYTKNTAKMLALEIQMVYKEFFRKRSIELSRKTDKRYESRFAELKPFFSMLLKKEVPAEEINDIRNFRLNKERILFFDPCDTKCVKKTLERLSKLKPLRHSNFCFFDNPFFQYMKAQIHATLQEDLQYIFMMKNRICFQKLMLDLKEEDKKILRNTFKQKLVKLQQENQGDQALECVFHDTHIESIPVARSFYDLFSNTFSSLQKTFTYTGQEPIYRIEATYENAELKFVQPTESFVKKNFRMLNRLNKQIFEASAGKSIVQDKWVFKHVVRRGMDAKCEIRMYSKHTELSATKYRMKQIERLKGHIEAIECPENLLAIRSHGFGRKKAGSIYTYKQTVGMLYYFYLHIFRSDSSYVSFLRECIQDLEDATDLT